MAEKIFSKIELQRFSGDDGGPLYIAHQGIVYDVSDCPKWHRGIHENMHFPGQELTSELPDAPHGVEVFTRPCVKRIGRMQTSQDLEG